MKVETIHEKSKLKPEKNMTKKKKIKNVMTKEMPKSSSCFIIRSF